MILSAINAAFHQWMFAVHMQAAVADAIASLYVTPSAAAVQIPSISTIGERRVLRVA